MLQEFDRILGWLDEIVVQENTVYELRLPEGKNMQVRARQEKERLSDV